MCFLGSSKSSLEFLKETPILQFKLDKNRRCKINQFFELTKPLFIHKMLEMRNFAKTKQISWHMKFYRQNGQNFALNQTATKCYMFCKLAPVELSTYYNCHTNQSNDVVRSKYKTCHTTLFHCFHKRKKRKYETMIYPELGFI